MRKIMRPSMVFCLALGLTLACPALAHDKDAAKKDMDQLQGSWRVVSSQVGDEKAAEEEVKKRRLTFTGDKLIYEYGNEQKERREGTIKLDSKTGAFDWTVTSGGETLGTMLAIYELKGDDLKIGFGNDRLVQVRPTRWKIGKDDVVWLLVLKRERPDEKASTINEPGWVADASRATLPKRPAAGRLHGRAFAVEMARIAPYSQASGNVGDPPEKQDRVDGAVLTLQQGNDREPTNYYTIFLAVKPGDTVDGKTFVVPAGGLFKQTEKLMDKDGKGWFYPVTGVQANSEEVGQKARSDLLPKVTLRLKFGKRKDGRLPGTIYLCIDDKEKSFVTGTFEAVVEQGNKRN